MIFARCVRWIRLTSELGWRGPTGLGLVLGAMAYAHAQPLPATPAGGAAGLRDTPPPTLVAQRDELEREVGWLEQWREQQCRTPDPGVNREVAPDTQPVSPGAAEPDPRAAAPREAQGEPSAQLAVFLAEAASLRIGWNQLAQQLASRLGRLEKVWQERFVLAQCPSRYGAHPPCLANASTREAIQKLRGHASEAWRGSSRRLTLFQTVVQQDGSCLGALTLDQWLRREREHLQLSGEWLGTEVQRLQALR